jgi:6-phosphofructokinase 1
MTKPSAVDRVGILTGGGDCPGLNAVIRGVAKAAISRYGADVCGIKDGYRGLIENDMEPLSWDSVSGILTEGGTILGASNKANPFEYYGSSAGEPEDRSDQAVKHFHDADLDLLFALGGDGTLSIANKLQQKGIPVIGVPKTIDNDVCETDVTFGFDTAVQTVAFALDKLHTTAQSHHRIMVVETMGRYTGWLALTGGMAGGGDIILIPEISYSLENIEKAIEKRRSMGRTFSIIVVAEGVTPPSGDYIVRKEEGEDAHDHVRLGGIGYWLSDILEERTNSSCRAVVLGHLQRGGSPTAYDRMLATRFGTAAMAQAAEGHSGIMIALKGTNMEAVALDKVADRQRNVSPDSQIVESARSVGTCLGDGSTL